MTTPRMKNIWSKAPEPVPNVPVTRATEIIQSRVEPPESPASIPFTPAPKEEAAPRIEFFKPPLEVLPATTAPSTTAATVDETPITGKGDDYRRDNRRYPRRRLPAKKRRVTTISIALSEEEERILREFMYKRMKHMSFSNWARTTLFKAAGVPIPDRGYDE